MSARERVNWGMIGAAAAVLLLAPGFWALNKETVKLVATPDELRDFEAEVRTNFVNVNERLDELQGKPYRQTTNNRKHNENIDRSIND